MASLGVARQKWWSPYALLEIDVTASPSLSDQMAASDLAARCYVLRVLQYADVAACLRALSVPADPNGIPAVGLYADWIARYESTGRPLLPDSERLELVGALISAKSLDSAEHLLGGMQMTPRNRGDFLTRQALLRLARGESISDAQLSELLTAAPLNPFARNTIVRALAKRGERTAALGHLQFLRHLGVSKRETMALAQQLELGLPGERGGS
jgi:hypothetical protein